MRKTKREDLVFIASIWATVLILICVYWLFPLRNTSKAMLIDLWSMEQEMTTVESLLSKYSNDDRSVQVSREEISLIIDKIAGLGESMQIEFDAITPKESESVRKKGSYSKLSIFMGLKGHYQNIGEFLGELEQMENSALTIRDFQINRDEDILPLVSSQLTAEVYFYDD